MVEYRSGLYQNFLSFARYLQISDVIGEGVNIFIFQMKHLENIVFLLLKLRKPWLNIYQKVNVQSSEELRFLSLCIWQLTMKAIGDKITFLDAKYHGTTALVYNLRL